jgi:hypothetical protein
MDRYGPETHVQQHPQQGGTRGGGSWLYALVFGLLLASWEGRATGFAVGAALGYLLARVLQLTQRVTELERQQGLGASAPAEPVPVVASRPPTAATPSPAADDASAGAISRPSAADASPVGDASQPASSASVSASVHAPAWARVPATAPLSPSPLERGIASALRWFKGGNPLARAGIVILFFGLAFLAKYAAERTVVPLELRFVLIAATALGLLVIGWRLRTRRRIYAHLLQGGGVAGLYLTVFAATRLYALLPVGLALGLMAVIAVAAALLAVAQHSLPLAVIGTAGGFMAPLLVSTGSGNHIALFSYYAVLNLGIFVVAWFRAWRVLNLVGFVFTFGITSLFRVTSYTPDQRVSTAAFLLLFFLLYVGISILFSLRQKLQLRGYVSGSLVFGLPVAGCGVRSVQLAGGGHSACAGLERACDGRLLPVAGVGVAPQRHARTAAAGRGLCRDGADLRHSRRSTRLRCPNDLRDVGCRGCRPALARAAPATAAGACVRRAAATACRRQLSHRRHTGRRHAHSQRRLSRCRDVSAGRWPEQLVAASHGGGAEALGIGRFAGVHAVGGGVVDLRQPAGDRERMAGT